jgi:hypothetical protein
MSTRQFENGAQAGAARLFLFAVAMTVAGLRPPTEQVAEIARHIFNTKMLDGVFPHARVYSGV